MWTLGNAGMGALQVIIFSQKEEFSIIKAIEQKPFLFDAHLLVT
jgi:hypothetical protein